MKFKIFILILLLSIPCYNFAQRAYEPWYTGPLIASSGSNLDKGLVNIQPYLYFRNTFGEYNKAWGHHSTPSTFTFKAEIDFQAGISRWLDFTFVAQSFYKKKEKKETFAVGDIGAKFGIQLLREKDFTAIPYIRLTIQEVFPTGRYNNLDPNKHVIESTGSGSFETVFNFIVMKTVYWFENHPISFRLNASYTYSTDVTVKNFNTYGGGFGTRGTVSPGDVYAGIFAFEYSLNQKWVLAMDTVYVYAKKTTFRGTPGVDFNGTTASSAQSSSNQTSLAPAIEYNVNANFGVLAGVHFSIRGNNSTKFKSAIISATYTF